MSADANKPAAWKFWVATVFGVVVGVATPIGFYLFSRRYMAEFLSERDSIVMAVVTGLAVIAALGLGIYNHAQVTFRGRDLDELNARLLRLSLPQNPLFWFWVLVPLLLPLFVSIYMLFLMLLALMIEYPLAKFAPGVAEAIGGPLARVTTAIAWGFGLFSMGLLWREMRRQRREQLRKRAAVDPGGDA